MVPVYSHALQLRDLVVMGYLREKPLHGLNAMQKLKEAKNPSDVSQPTSSASEGKRDHQDLADPTLLRLLQRKHRSVCNQRGTDVRA